MGSQLHPPELCADFTDSSFTRQWGVGNFGNGVTAFNYYMIIGGTNWGYSGAPASGFTSYDYGAALNEDRTITPKLAAQKELGYFQNAFPQLLTMDPVDAPAVAELTGAEVRTYQHQAIEDRGNSVTGNGARYIGARLANSNLTTDTSFTIPLVLYEGTVGAGPLFTTDDRDPAITWTGSWEEVSNSEAFEGTLTRSNTTGAALTHTFVGEGTHTVRAILADAVSGQELFTSAPANIEVTGDDVVVPNPTVTVTTTPTVTITPTVTVTPSATVTVTTTAPTVTKTATSPAKPTQTATQKPFDVYTTPGAHEVNGRQWRTECNTPATGRDGCRSYAWVSHIGSEQNADGSWRYFPTQGWVLNNIVRFKTS